MVLIEVLIIFNLALKVFHRIRLKKALKTDREVKFLQNPAAILLPTVIKFSS
jgi:hypothetical protein